VHSHQRRKMVLPQRLRSTASLAAGAKLPVRVAKLGGAAIADQELAAPRRRKACPVPAFGPALGAENGGARLAPPRVMRGGALGGFFVRGSKPNGPRPLRRLMATSGMTRKDKEVAELMGFGRHHMRFVFGCDQVFAHSDDLRCEHPLRAGKRLPDRAGPGATNAWTWRQSRRPARRSASARRVRFSQS
jgi:hypothetical protein